MATSRGALLGVAATPDQLPKPTADSVIFQRADLEAVPGAPFVWSPAALDWVLPSRPISRLAFRWRFTLAEQVAIQRAEHEHDDPDVRATLAVLRQSLAEATEVDLEDPRTRQAAAILVDVLVGEGVIPLVGRAARLAQILTPPGV